MRDAFSFCLSQPPPAGYVPVSAYGGSSNNIKDLTDSQGPRAGPWSLSFSLSLSLPLSHTHTYFLSLSLSLSLSRARSQPPSLSPPFALSLSAPSSGALIAFRRIRPLVEQSLPASGFRVEGSEIRG